MSEPKNYKEARLDDQIKWHSTKARHNKGHATTYRILLRKAGKASIAIMVNSPYHKYDQTRFSITEAGVQDVQEHKGAASGW